MSTLSASEDLATTLPKFVDNERKKNSPGYESGTFLSCFFWIGVPVSVWISPLGTFESLEDAKHSLSQIALGFDKVLKPYVIDMLTMKAFEVDRLEVSNETLKGLLLTVPKQLPGNRHSGSRHTIA